jgi:hypothetical protein
MEKENFIEMCKEQFITWESIEHNLDKLFKKNAIDLKKVEDYKEVYAVMDAIYRRECFGFTNGSAYPEVNMAQKRKSTKYYKRLFSKY